MGLFGTPSNREKQTRMSGNRLKRCGSCRGTGRARGMGSSGARCAVCGGAGMR